MESRFLRVFYYALWSVCVIGFVGCGETSEPSALQVDEVQQYLDEHPELKEPKEEHDFTKLSS